VCLVNALVMGFILHILGWVLPSLGCVLSLFTLPCDGYAHNYSRATA